MATSPITLRMREKDFFDGRREVTDMDHRGTTWAHEKGRFFHCVVANRDDQIGSVNGLMNVVAFGERGCSDVEIGSASRGAFAHLGCEERNTQPGE